MSKTTLLIIGVIVLAVLAWWWYGMPTIEAPGFLGGPDDSTDAINEDLNSVDVGAELDSDFEAVDADLGNL